MSGLSHTVSELNQRRCKAVQQRMNGRSPAPMCLEFSLSAPTIMAAVRACEAGGSAAVGVEPRRRPRSNGQDTQLSTHLGPNRYSAAIDSSDKTLWNTEAVRSWLKSRNGLSSKPQVTSSLFCNWQLAPLNLHRTAIAS